MTLPRRLITVLLAAVVVMFTATLATPAPAAQADPISTAACAIGDAIIPGGCNASKSAGDVAKSVAKDAASDGFKGIVQSILQGAGTAMVTVLTWFVKIPTPQAAEYSAIGKVKELTLRLQLIFMAVSIIAGGIRLMLAKRHAVYAAGEEQFQAMARAVIGAWMFGGFLTALSLGTDALSVAWLNSVTKGDAPAKVVERIVNTKVLMEMGSGLVLIVGILGVLGAVFQAIVLVVRQAMLILVTAYIPIMGAASGTELGKAAFSKTVRWVIALLLWKLVAASCFVVAFELAGAGGKTDQMQVFYGFILLFLSALVLPMLMKLVSAGLSMSGGSGLQAGMMVAGVVAAGGTLAAGGAGGGGAASTASQTGAATNGPPSGGPPSGGDSSSGGVSRPSGGGSSEGAGSAPSSGGSPGGGRSPSSGGNSGGGSMDGAGASSNVPSASAMPTTDSSSGGGSSSSSGGGGGNRFSAASDAMSATSVMSQQAEAFFDGGDDGMGADGGMR